MRLKVRKRLFAICAGFLLIAAGFWFTTTSVYKFGKGYFMYKLSPESSVQVNATAEPEKKWAENQAELYPRRPENGEEIGELYIPKISSLLPIYHGTAEEELERGVGHFAGSVLPGEKDNSVLSGHRDTVFRKLGEVGKGDVLIVTTEAGKFEYKVNKVRIVDADDRTVIVPRPRATLTVTTCYPFNFIGDAPQRYILTANLVNAEPVHTNNENVN